MIQNTAAHTHRRSSTWSGQESSRCDGQFQAENCQLIVLPDYVSSFFLYLKLLLRFELSSGL